jgi:hypothetical protein
MQQQARELLAPVRGWFTERFDTLDLRRLYSLNWHSATTESSPLFKAKKMGFKNYGAFFKSLVTGNCCVAAPTR